jgi:large subunit ribosomal protein L21
MEYIMYAVIQSGGKQHRVVVGETLKVELLKAETGSTLTFNDVLMVVNGESIQIGAPVVAGATVTAEVVSHGRHDKIRIVKFRRRKHYRKQQGHRQWFTALKITGING